MKPLFAIALFFIPGLAGIALADPAQPAADSSAPAEAASAPAENPAPAQKTLKKKGSKRASEKETEGTEAADRFQADTVLKSKYRVNGQQLEVDPD